jgi:hypothetical protein
VRVHVLFHDRCFDGLASAATFTRFYRDRIDPAAEFTYQGLTHGAGSSWSESVFTDAAVHACVDFRYSPSDKLTWWFDHHQSAFEKPEDEAAFHAKKSERQHWDPAAKSCTKYLARVAHERYGFDAGPISELVEWAETIDGALFPDAKTAVELEAPAMKLMLLAEATPDAGTLLPRIIRDLATRTLSEVVASDYVQAALEPLLANHWATVERVRARARLEGNVCTFDLADDGLDNFNKFISYYLFPQALYTVAVSRGTKRSKVSVGSNPWRQAERTHNIADICAGYGGGGHPAVGATSFAPGDLEKARQAAREIVAKLRG